MRRTIALILLLSGLTACAAPPAQNEVPEVPQAAVSGEESIAASPSDALDGTVTYAQAAPEHVCYSVTLETLEDAALAEDGTELVTRAYQLPVMTASLADGSPLTEASTPAEEMALAAVKTFNDQFQAWAAADGFDEIADRAEEDRAFQEESGLAWNPYALELNCSVYQTEQFVSVRAEYYSNTGGAHPNTVLLAWNFDLAAGQFFTPEQLAVDAEAFSAAVQSVLLRQSQENAEAQGLPLEDFFWSNYQEILADWSSYAVSFDETGMQVAFSPYELAAYAAGPQIYHLDYSQFSGYLSAHGAAMLGLEPEEK